MKPLVNISAEEKSTLLTATWNGEKLTHTWVQDWAKELVGKTVNSRQTRNFWNWEFEIGDSKTELQFAMPERKAEVYFDQTDFPQREIVWSNRQGRRDRQARLLLYSKNNVYRFEGIDIPGICVVLKTDYTKDGKWSHNTYTIVLAAGVKYSAIMQGWDSGNYVDNVTSIGSIANDLGLQGCTNAAVEDCIKRYFLAAYCRWQHTVSAIIEIEAAAENAGAEVIEYEYERARITNRAGRNILLVDGEPFMGEPIENVTIISAHHSSGQGGGRQRFQLLILSTCEIEEVQEFSAYGNDSLEDRGYIQDENGKWMRPMPQQKEHKEEGYSISDLKNKFGK